MNLLKKRLSTIAVLVSAMGVIASCSKSEDGPINPTPEPPVGKVITLTQLDASLSEPTTVTRAANPEETNVMKTAFTGGDFFQFSYTAPVNGAQIAYAHTTDGKSWTFRKTADASSETQNIYLASDKPEIKATYLPLAAAGATDGIVVGTDNTVTCYDALQATANATIAGDKANASLRFTHVNHLLRFNVEGNTTAADINYVLLTLTYTDAAGKSLKSVIKTSLHTEYTTSTGTKLNVVQAIVPREAILQGVTAVFTSGESLVVNDPDHSPANLACPGGKSRLIALRMSNNGELTLQPGDIANGWADGGTLNSTGENIYINSAADLEAFRDAVNANPESSAAKINGITAYTANVIQTADIVLDATKDWTPIGGKLYTDTYFAGTYNGNGYTISNLKVSTSTIAGNGASYYAGLFGYVKSPKDRQAVLTGIHLRNVSINVNMKGYVIFAGALVGVVGETAATQPVVISLCSATGTVKASSQDARIQAGGLVGGAEHLHLTRCSVNVSVTTLANETSSAGGLIGTASDSAIASCYAKGAVSVETGATVKAYAGGIVGDLNENRASAVLMACRADGDVKVQTGNANAGGLVGISSGATIGSIATGTVSGTGYVGAIVGDNNYGRKLALCYGTSANDAGSSRRADANSNNIVYNTSPASGDILSIVNGTAWRIANYGNNKAETVQGGIITTINPFAAGQYSINIQSRLWVLFDENSPWSSTSQGGSSLYPAPVMNYAGQ